MIRGKLLILQSEMVVGVAMGKMDKEKRKNVTAIITGNFHLPQTKAQIVYPDKRQLSYFGTEIEDNQKLISWSKKDIIKETDFEIHLRTFNLIKTDTVFARVRKWAMKAQARELKKAGI